MKQIKAMSPSSIQRLLNLIQYAMPLRIKEIHIVKQPMIFEMIWVIMKPFLQEKMKKRVSRKKLLKNENFVKIHVCF